MTSTAGMTSCALDRWLQVFPADDPRHDEAERELMRVSYKRGCAFQRLKQFEQ